MKKRKLLDSRSTAVLFNNERYEEPFHAPPLAFLAGAAVWRLSEPSMQERKRIVGDDAFRFVGPPELVTRRMRYIDSRTGAALTYLLLLTSYGAPWGDGCTENFTGDSSSFNYEFVGETVKFWGWKSSFDDLYMIPGGEALTYAEIQHRLGEENDRAMDEWMTLHGVLVPFTSVTLSDGRVRNLLTTLTTWPLEYLMTTETLREIDDNAVKCALSNYYVLAHYLICDDPPSVAKPVLYRAKIRCW